MHSVDALLVRLAIIQSSLLLMFAFYRVFSPRVFWVGTKVLACVCCVSFFCAPVSLASLVHSVRRRTLLSELAAVVAGGGVHAMDETFREMAGRGKEL